MTIAMFSGLLLVMQGLTADSSAEARKAVSDFYDWYAPAAAHTPGTDMQSLRDNRWHFGIALTRALRADSAAAAKSADEIVGLDMDPFLNSQDPCDRYHPVNVRRSGAKFLVDVIGSGGCAPHSTPDVTVVVRFNGATPVFTNFIYSAREHDDLLGLLAQLAADRAKKH